MRKVVGLLGIRGAGKDTAAKVFLAAGWKRLSFGDAIYNEVSLAFNVSVDFLQRRETKELPQAELALRYCTDELFVGLMVDLEAQKPLMTRLSRWFRRALKGQNAFTCPRSPREIMQIWGTEYRRGLYRDDYWRDQVRQQLLAEPDTNFVITDVRYPDEAEMIIGEFQGELDRVERPALGGSNDPSLQHPSERMMLGYPVHRTLLNGEGEQGLSHLAAQIEAAHLDSMLRKAA